jgi:hypothetical protein
MNYLEKKPINYGYFSAFVDIQHVAIVKIGHYFDIAKCWHCGIQSMPLLLIEESKNTNLIFIWSGLTDGRNHDLQTGDRGIRTAIPNSPKKPINYGYFSAFVDIQHVAIVKIGHELTSGKFEKCSFI